MEHRKTDIHKAAGIIIRDRRLLVSRSKNKDFFVAPGGKLEGDETAERALIRELYEEQGIVVEPADIALFGTFYGIAKGHEAEQFTIPWMSLRLSLVKMSRRHITKSPRTAG